jgi:glycerol-3-phosphate O-acyltransferase
MQALTEQMAKGGVVFWVAPSGGRDRPNEEDKFVVSPFDIKALDMFKLLAMQCGKVNIYFKLPLYNYV